MKVAVTVSELSHFEMRGMEVVGRVDVKVGRGKREC